MITFTGYIRWLLQKPGPRPCYSHAGHHQSTTGHHDRMRSIPCGQVENIRHSTATHSHYLASTPSRWRVPKSPSNGRRQHHSLELAQGRSPLSLHHFFPKPIPILAGSGIIHARNEPAEI